MTVWTMGSTVLDSRLIPPIIGSWFRYLLRPWNASSASTVPLNGGLSYTRCARNNRDQCRTVGGETPTMATVTPNGIARCQHVRSIQSFRSESLAYRSQETLRILKGRRHRGHRYRDSDARTWLDPHRGQETRGPKIARRKIARILAGDGIAPMIDIGTA
jgi:hypothetical protein